MQQAEQGRADPSYRRLLSDDLVLRWSTLADVDRIVALYSHVFRNSADAPPNQYIAAWTRQLMDGSHPLCSGDDFAVVERIADGAIIASTCLMFQDMRYQGIPFRMGRPEIVATHPDYRNRGLIRAIFDLIHARSDARGYPISGITGIPYYYRQFGYEYATDLDTGRIVYFTALADLKPDESEPYSLRAATPEDATFIADLYALGQRNAAMSTIIPPDYLTYTMTTQNPASSSGWNIYVILSAESSQPVGYVLRARMYGGTSVSIHDVQVKSGIALRQVAMPVLRALRSLAPAMESRSIEKKPASDFYLNLGAEHPFYTALGDRLAPPIDSRYAWYIRVPDIPAFLRLIAPAVEQRLLGSALEGYTGTLKMDCYRQVFQWTFSAGKVMAIEPVTLGPYEDAQCGMPIQALIPLIFQYRSFAELRHMHMDVWADGDSRVLLPILFPKVASSPLPLD